MTCWPESASTTIRASGLHADPRHVARLLRGGQPLHLADRRLDGDVLRLVRGSAARLAAGVFGDQTDVPESADWWDASQLLVWGTNLPITRTPERSS
jgi:hypothetical protein